MPHFSSQELISVNALMPSMTGQKFTISSSKISESALLLEIEDHSNDVISDIANSYKNRYLAIIKDFLTHAKKNIAELESNKQQTFEQRLERQEKALFFLGCIDSIIQSWFSTKTSYIKLSLYLSENEKKEYKTIQEELPLLVIKLAKHRACYCIASLQMYQDNIERSQSNKEKKSLLEDVIIIFNSLYKNEFSIEYIPTITQTFMPLPGLCSIAAFVPEDYLGELAELIAFYEKLEKQFPGLKIPTREQRKAAEIEKITYSATPLPAHVLLRFLTLKNAASKMQSHKSSITVSCNFKNSDKTENNPLSKKIYALCDETQKNIQSQASKSKLKKLLKYKEMLNETTLTIGVIDSMIPLIHTFICFAQASENTENIETCAKEIINISTHILSSDSLTERQRFSFFEIIQHELNQLQQAINLFTWNKNKVSKQAQQPSKTVEKITGAESCKEASEDKTTEPVQVSDVQSCISHPIQSAFLNAFHAISSQNYQDALDIYNQLENNSEISLGQRCELHIGRAEIYQLMLRNINTQEMINLAKLLELTNNNYKHMLASKQQQENKFIKSCETRIKEIIINNKENIVSAIAYLREAIQAYNQAILTWDEVEDIDKNDSLFELIKQQFSQCKSLYETTLKIKTLFPVWNKYRTDLLKSLGKYGQSSSKKISPLAEFGRSIKTSELPCPSKALAELELKLPEESDPSLIYVFSEKLKKEESSLELITTILTPPPSSISETSSNSDNNEEVQLKSIENALETRSAKKLFMTQQAYPIALAQTLPFDPRNPINFLVYLRLNGLRANDPISAYCFQQLHCIRQDSVSAINLIHELTQWFAQTTEMSRLINLAKEIGLFSMLLPGVHSLLTSKDSEGWHKKLENSLNTIAKQSPGDTALIISILWQLETHFCETAKQRTIPHTAFFTHPLALKWQELVEEYSDNYKNEQEVLATLSNNTSSLYGTLPGFNTPPGSPPLIGAPEAEAAAHP